MAATTVLSGPEHFLLCLDVLAQIHSGCLSSSDPQRPSLGPLVHMHNGFPPRSSPSFDCSAGMWGLGLLSPPSDICGLSLTCLLLCSTWKKKKGQQILVALNGSDFKDAAGAEVGQEEVQI